MKVIKHTSFKLEEKAFRSFKKNKNSFINVTEAVVQRCSVKIVFLEISQDSQENTCATVSFLIKKTLAQVFSCEFCEISENTFFHITPLVDASDVIGDKFVTSIR